MIEEEARHFELVRAVELEDREASLLTREDRAQADTRARSAAEGLKGRKFQHRYLASRAAFAAKRLATRHPGIAELLSQSRWPRWIGWVLPLLALAAGFLANEFGTAKRLDLLAVPLLGTVGWNLFVYLWLILAAVTGANRRVVDPLARGVRKIGEIGKRGNSEGSTIDRAAAAFRKRWLASSAPLVAARTSRTLHLGAALFALGLIGGIYLRALVTEYRAGWESTFLGPDAVHALLSLVLGPASAATGVAIPGVAEIAAMRWTGAETGGVNAGPWLHLYSVTVVGLVVIPRLLLAFFQSLKGWRLRRNFPVAGREDFYVRRLLRASGAHPGRARITPYAYRPGEQNRRSLETALKGMLGDGAEIRFDDPVDYGSEETWRATHQPDPRDDYHLLLFTLSATPEEENHGEIARVLAAEEGRCGQGTIVGALVDESQFRAHFAGQAGLDGRVETRLAAWRSVMANAGLDPLGIDLTEEQSDALAERLEANLLPDAELYG